MGTGDGVFVYSDAIKTPKQFFIGIGSHAEKMAEYSRKSAKIKKEKVSNMLFVLAGIETLPVDELFKIATSINILFPWGTLLAAVAKPNIQLLGNIASLRRSKARLQIIFGYDSEKDKKIIERFQLPSLTEDHIETVLRKDYLEAGFEIKWKYPLQEELKKVLQHGPRN